MAMRWSWRLVPVLALAMLALAGPGAVAAAQPPTTLRIQASWPSSLTIFEHLKMFAERVDKLSNGQLRIEPLPAGAAVPLFDVLDATSKRTIDGAHTFAHYWAGRSKAGVLFTGGPGGPFGMDAIDYLGWVYEGGGIELYQQYYRDVLKLNVVPIPAFPASPQAFGWFKRPIKSAADLRGLKCRQTGVAAEVFAEMGMRVVNLPGGEIVPAAERGAIDCAEWVGGVEDLRLGLHNVWKYYYTPGLHESVSVGEIILNGDVWKGLSPQFQEILKSAATETFTRWWARWQMQNAEALRELRDKHKVQILKTPDDVLRAFLKAWDRVAAREADKDPFFKKVLESQRQYAALVVPAKRVAFPPYDLAADHYWPPPRAAAGPPAPARKR